MQKNKMSFSVLRVWMQMSTKRERTFLLTNTIRRINGRLCRINPYFYLKAAMDESITGYENDLHTHDLLFLFLDRCIFRGQIWPHVTCSTFAQWRSETSIISTLHVLYATGYPNGQTLMTARFDVEAINQVKTLADNHSANMSTGKKNEQWVQNNNTNLTRWSATL